MPEIKIDGLVELKKGLAKKIPMDAVKRVVRFNGAALQRGAQNKAQFRGHWEGNEFVKPTGNLKRNIVLDIQDDGLTAEVEPKAEHSAYVEYGTRFMSAQPYLRPAYHEQYVKFVRDMEKLVK